MTDIPFDTLAVERRLKAGDLTEKQAEAITEAIHVGVTGGVATKSDFARLETSFLWVKIIGASLVAANIAVIAYIADLVRNWPAGG